MRLSQLIGRMTRWLVTISSVNKFYGEVSMDGLRSEVTRTTSTQPAAAQSATQDGDSQTPPKESGA